MDLAVCDKDAANSCYYVPTQGDGSLTENPGLPVTSHCFICISLCCFVQYKGSVDRTYKVVIYTGVYDLKWLDSFVNITALWQIRNCMQS